MEYPNLVKTCNVVKKLNREETHRSIYDHLSIQNKYNFTKITGRSGCVPSMFLLRIIEFKKRLCVRSSRSSVARRFVDPITDQSEI